MLFISIYSLNYFSILSSIYLSNWWDEGEEKLLIILLSSKIFSSFECALNEAGSRTIFIIGGGQIYSSLLPQCNELYITEVQQVIENGDAFFPSFEKDFIPTETLEENKEFIIKKWKRIAS